MNRYPLCQAVRGLAFLLAGSLGAIGVAHAGSFTVNPVRITLSAKQPVVALTVRNSDADPTLVQIETLAWSQSTGEEVLVPSADLLATPPIFTIAPGATQILRVGLRKPPASNSEISYRLILREVPQKRMTQGMQIALRISMPVFVLPANAAVAPRVQWRATREGDGGIRLHAMNGGTAHVQMTNLSIANAAGGEAIGNRAVAQYLLPGISRDWLIESKSPPGVGAKLQIIAKTDAGAMQADVVLEAASASATGTPTASLAAR